MQPWETSFSSAQGKAKARESEKPPMLGRAQGARAHRRGSTPGQVKKLAGITVGGVGRAKGEMLPPELVL